MSEASPAIIGAAQSARTEARRSHVLALQRVRRQRLRRIDYYPDEAAAAIIEKLRVRRAGTPASPRRNTPHARLRLDRRVDKPAPPLAAPSVVHPGNRLP